MPHTDEELLARLALQEVPLDDETAAHLETCGECRLELDELTRVVNAGRTNLALSSVLVPPPAHVWTDVARVAGRGQAGEGAASSHAGADDAVRGPAAVSEPSPLPPRPRRRVPTWLAVAAGLVVGMAGGGLLFQQLGADERPGGVVVATARLSQLGPHGTTGEADVRETAAGPVLHVHVARRTPGRGFREVWLLQPKTGRLVSVGALNGTDATFPLPSGLDLRDYPTVDISREPFDGDPAHSADSIARGTLAG